MSAQTAYPLAWPAGWPRTVNRERWPSKVTLTGALSSLRDEVRRLGGAGLVLSSNVTLGSERPADPAVVAYFQWNKQEVAIPCDRWATVEGNVRAISLTIEAMRGMERWGAKAMLQAMFRGFKALPASSVDCWSLLSLQPGSSAQEIEAAFRAAAKLAHPDMGGSAEGMAALNRAREEALTTIKGGAR